MHKVSNNDSRKEVDEINRLLNELFPITRSLTGPGNRETLRILQDLVPLEIREYPCGSDVYDWVIPAEWVIKDAYIKNECGDRIVDFKKSNLHVVGYSTPVDLELDFASLRPHLHTIKAEEGVIPYRTSYYKRDWGFCVTRSQFEELEKSEGTLSVKIDSDQTIESTLTNEEKD